MTRDINDVEIIAKAFSVRTPSQFNNNLVRSKPDFWEESCWRMTYGFLKSWTRYNKMRNDPTLDARFHNTAHKHDGFRVEHCIKARERRLLRFMVSIMKAEKLPSSLINSCRQSLSLTKTDGSSDGAT